MRIGKAVELPEVLDRWEKQAVEVEDRNKTKRGSVTTNSSKMHLGCKVYAAQWKVRYLVSRSAVGAALDLGVDLDKMLFGTTDDPNGLKAWNE